MITRDVKPSEKLAKSLDKHFLACAAAATAVVGVGAVEEAEAVIRYSGTLNQAIPVSITGLYIDIDGNLRGTAAQVPNWDFNLFNSNSTTTLKRAALNFSPTARPSATVGVQGPPPGSTLTSAAWRERYGRPEQHVPHPPLGYPYSILAYRSSTGPTMPRSGTAA